MLKISLATNTLLALIAPPLVVNTESPINVVSAFILIATTIGSDIAT